MFPNPLGNNRSAPGVYNGGSYGTSYESYNGSTIVTSTLAINNPDASDVEEFQYWNGAAWAAIASLGVYMALSYFPGSKIRSRLVNAYFGTTGSYTEGTDSNYEDTGGTGTIALVAPIVTSKPAYIDPGSIQVFYSVAATMTHARNLYGATVFINASYKGIDGLQHQVNTTLTVWPNTTASQAVVISTPYAADLTTTAHVFWFAQVSQIASWVDSGPTALVTTTYP